MKNRIKIAYLLTPIDFGGAEKVSLNFLKNVDRNKFSIWPIVLVRPWENFNLFIEGIKKENYQYLTIPVARKPLSKGRDYFRVIRCFRILFSILRKQRYNLVHSNGYFADIISIPVSRLLGMPHISTCHGFISNDRNLSVYNRLDRLVLRFSDKIIAVSENIRDDLVRNGIKKSRITVIQNAIQTAANEAEKYAENRRKKRASLAIKNDEILVGYVGRLSDEKGVQYLIEAGMLLIEAGMSCKILIIGDGPQREELKHTVKQKGLERAIIFTGFQTDVEKWMPCLDIFVLPSLTEGTPMALLEAMLFGIPVVASDVGGIPKVIRNGENGILVDSADPKALAQKIKKLIGIPDLRVKIGRSGSDLIKKEYDVIEWCRKIEKCYCDLIIHGRG